MEPRTCAYPGCDVIYQPTNGRQRYHDPRESWLLSNRKWYAANKEKKAAINRAYANSVEGFIKRYDLNRGYELRTLRERTEERLAALDREEQECRMLLESQTRMR